jgi:YD repeat-containing protein
LSASLNLLAPEAMSQEGPETRRCLTREQLNIEPIFSACPPLIDEASVSDNSFVARLDIDGGPNRYTMRWAGPGYFNEDIFTYNEATGSYDGICGTRACSIAPGGWVQMEHWDYFVGTLLAENVGSWSYTELHDGSVYQSREFDVRELSLTASSGAGQIGIVDQELPEPLVLKLQSHEGTGIEGETIGWMIDGPKGARGASVRGIGSGSETNAEGTDQATVRLGSKPGVYTVRLQNRRITGNSEPVFTFTAIDDIQDTIGNKFQREVDLEPSGLSPIGFVRFHNSLGFVSGSFDSYWTHSYDRRVQLPEDLEQEPVKVFRPDGRKINFRATGSGFEPYPGVRSILEQTASGWRFTDEDLTVEYFDQDGLLAEITDLSGRSQTASRDSRGRLLRIDSNTGEYLGFAYDSKERLAEVSDQAGRQWAYLYDSLGRLSQVDNPDGTSRRYHYEDLRHAYALTGITAGTMRTAGPLLRTGLERPAAWTSITNPMAAALSSTPWATPRCMKPVSRTGAACWRVSADRSARRDVVRPRPVTPMTANSMSRARPSTASRRATVTMMPTAAQLTSSRHSAPPLNGVLICNMTPVSRAIRSG